MMALFLRTTSDCLLKNGKSEIRGTCGAVGDGAKVKLSAALPSRACSEPTQIAHSATMWPPATCAATILRTFSGLRSPYFTGGKCRISTVIIGSREQEPAHPVVTT